MYEVFQRTYFNNTLGDYLISAFIIIVGISLCKIFKRSFFVRIKRWSSTTVNKVDDFVVDTVDRLGIPAIYLGIIYLSLSYLTFPPKVEILLRNVAVVVITFYAVRLISSIIGILIRSYVIRQERGVEKVKQVSGLMVIVNIIIWTLAVLFLFDNMGYSVTALITGLGIGGIAVALAAQNILGDLFNYFVIFLDRPFEVGDFLTIDEKMGTVEYIGIKTTRLLSLTGEQLVFSNSDLTNSRIHNFKRMALRRIEFTLRVMYEITPEKLREVPDLLKSIVEEHKPIRFDRAHWVSYEESSLNFVIVYFVLSSDYNTYMDIQQSINFRIFEEFTERQIGFAYPATNVYIKNVVAGTEPRR
jgi:small-conductance mechanosensitive channel